MKIEMSNSQRMALCTIIAQVELCMKAHPGEHSEEFADFSSDPPAITKLEELLPLLIQPGPGVVEQLQEIGILPRCPNYALISRAILESLKRYVEQHVVTGGFLRAVLENNLHEAYCRGDGRSLTTMFDIVAYCHNELPRNCWGSPEAVTQWLMQKPGAPR